MAQARQTQEIGISKKTSLRQMFLRFILRERRTILLRRMVKGCFRILGANL